MLRELERERERDLYKEQGSQAQESSERNSQTPGPVTANERMAADPPLNASGALEVNAAGSGGLLLNAASPKSSGGGSGGYNSFNNEKMALLGPSGSAAAGLGGSGGSGGANAGSLLAMKSTGVNATGAGDRRGSSSGIKKNIWENSGLDLARIPSLSGKSLVFS